MPEDDSVVFPVVVFTARYGGAYEGAQWIALNECVDFEYMHLVQGDDLACSQFFETYERHKPIGRGSNPCAAYANLRLKLLRNPEQAWPNR
jgi:hypothetical protein